MSKKYSDSTSGYNDYSEESSFDLRSVWAMLVQYKYWFIASVIVCLAAAFVYLRFSTPVYSVYTKMLVKDKEHTPFQSSLNNTFADMGLTNNSNGFDNELEIIATKTLNKRVVRDLKLYSRYYIDGKVKDKEIYGKYSPYLIDMDSYTLDSLKRPITIDFVAEGNVVGLKIKSDDFEEEKKVASFPVALNTPYGKVQVEKNHLMDGMEMPSSHRAIIYPLDLMAEVYAAGLTVEATSKTTTIAAVSMNDIIPERGVDYLNRLVEVYNEDADIDNNMEAKRTKDFIEERLAIISGELNMTEEDLEKFKKNSGIVDYKSDATLDASQSVQYEQRLVELNTQLELVQSLLDYVNDKRNELQVVPSSIGLIDNSLIQTINKYNDIVLERAKLLRSASENSPAVTYATNEALGLLTALKTSLATTKRQRQMELSQIQGQKSKYTNRISSAPSKERSLANFTRQQEVKAGLYLMLLQKREENLITLSSSAYKAKQIEEPIVSGPVAPKKKMILLAALFAGLLLPFCVIKLRDLLNYRINSIEDLSALSDVPFFGSVPFVKALSKGTRTIVLKENRNSLMMEVYRVLRSNLPFVLPAGQKVIMFTSSTSGEGKTCVASNLGTSMAFAGKKVLLLGLDIRKPRLAGLFNLSDTNLGISNFLTRMPDDYAYLDSLIQKTEVSDNLDVLPAGTIPPNPAELLERENLTTAIEYLKTKYDYILMDTAPVGLVSDTITIAKNADLVFYVVRANYTLKADVAFLNSLHAEEKLPNLNVIFNGVKMDSPQGYNHRRYGYEKNRYGYAFASGYGYGYGESKKLEEV